MRIQRVLIRIGALLLLAGSMTGCRHEEEAHILDFFGEDEMPDSQNVIQVNQTLHYEGFTGIDPDTKVYVDFKALDVTVKEVLVAPDYCWFLVQVVHSDGTQMRKGDFSEIDESVVKMCSDMHFDMECTYNYSDQTIELNMHDEATFDKEKEYNDGYYLIYTYSDTEMPQKLPDSISLNIKNLEVGYPCIESFENESWVIMDEYDLYFQIPLQK